MKLYSLVCGAVGATLCGVGALYAQQFEELILPSPYRQSATQEWAIRNFYTFTMPRLGESIALMRDADREYSLYRRFRAPEFPVGYPIGNDKKSAGEIFRQNRAQVQEEGYQFWISSQSQKGSYDYKRQMKNGQLGWERLDDIGYFNGAYTGAQLFSREALERGFGLYKHARSGGQYGSTSTILLGNKPAGLIYAEMGYDYYVTELLDAPNPLSTLTEQKLQELRGQLRRSADEEYTARFQALLRQVFEYGDLETFAIVLRNQRERQAEAAREARAQQLYLERSIREREEAKRREEEERRRSYYPPPEPMSGPSTFPYPVPPKYQPVVIPPYQPPESGYSNSYKAPIPPYTHPYRPPAYRPPSGNENDVDMGRRP